MISSVTDNDVDPALLDELRRHDPVFSATIVIEPFPESSLRDLLAEVHAELAVSAAVSREQITRGAALAPLSESNISTLVILGAHTVASNAVRDLTRLRDFDRLQQLILVTSTSDYTHERLADTRSPADTARFLARLAGEYSEPSIATAPLSAGHGDLGDREIDAIARLAPRVGHTMRFFRRPQARLGVLAAALQLFDRPRSRPGTIVRLHALDVALHERGSRLRAENFADGVAHCQARTQLDLWLPAAIDPTPTRDPLTALDAALEHPIAMTAETTAVWLEGFDQARTRKVYQRAMELFADWRDRNAIAADDHDVEHLQDWAFDRLRTGAAPRTVDVEYAAVRRHHLYRLTGRRDATAKPAPVALRRPATPIALPEDLAVRLGSSRHGPQTGRAPDLLSRRRYRPSLESPNAHRLLELFDNDPEAAAARIQALRIPTELWLDVQPLLGPAAVRGDAQRMTGCLNAIVLILGTGLAWNALPLELSYGSGERAYRHLREWVQDGRWPEIRRTLEELGPPYRDLAWDRVSPYRAGRR